MNQIDGYNASLLRCQDPHELASWVNQIDSYDAHSPLLQDPHELASWVNEIDSYRRSLSATSRNPRAGIVGEPE